MRALLLLLVPSALARDIDGAPTFAKLSDPTALTAGEDVFTYWCWNCHGEGPGKPGTVALEAKYQGAVPALLTARTDLTPELVGYFVRNGISIMPFFRKTQISDAQLDALSVYLSRTETVR